MRMNHGVTIHHSVPDSLNNNVQLKKRSESSHLKVLKHVAFVLWKQTLIPTLKHLEVSIVKLAFVLWCSWTCLTPVREQTTKELWGRKKKRHKKRGWIRVSKSPEQKCWDSQKKCKNMSAVIRLVLLQQRLDLDASELKEQLSSSE